MKLPPDHVPGVGVVRNGAMGGLGQKLLEKMGWSEGEGLGKRRDGVREAIRIQEKHNTHGLGLKKKEDWDARRWTDIYETSLQNVQQSDGKSDSGSSESEMEVGRRVRENPDGTASTAGDRELKIYARLRKTRKLGRWSSRNGKLERIKKQERRLRQVASETSLDPPPKNDAEIRKSLKTKKKRKRRDSVETSCEGDLVQLRSESTREQKLQR